MALSAWCPKRQLAAHLEARATAPLCLILLREAALVQQRYQQADCKAGCTASSQAGCAGRASASCCCCAAVSAVGDEETRACWGLARAALGPAALTRELLPTTASADTAAGGTRWAELQPWQQGSCRVWCCSSCCCCLLVVACKRRVLLLLLLLLLAEQAAARAVAESTCSGGSRPRW